jgi:shikimate dehydrogenase
LTWPSRPTASTRVAAVIGDPVRHSLSPVIHNAAFEALGLDWVYVAFRVEPGWVGPAVAGMRALGLAGLSVTMPHKEAVVRHLDRLTPTASTLGAVNTVVWEGEELVGDSTDGAGFVDALSDEGVDPRGMRAVVLGAGGAARAVVLALYRAGAADISVVPNRRPERAEQVAAVAPGTARPGTVEEVGGADLVVNATPAGMGDGRLPFDLDPELLGPERVVVDLVYRPPLTPLLEAARVRRAMAVPGLGMLVRQGAHQVRLWTGQDPPVEVMSAAALAALSRE